MFIKAKEVLIRKLTFSQLPVSLVQELSIYSRIAHKRITIKSKKSDLIT